MPYCPRCKTEFVAGVSVCSDCGVELVSALTPEQMEDEDHPNYQYEVATEALGEIQTRILCAELEQAGIPYILSGDELSTVHVYPAKDSRVWVPKRYLEKTKELLETVLTPAEDESLEAAAADDNVEIFFCDHCGAEVPSDAKKCPECGESFE